MRLSTIETQTEEAQLERFDKGTIVEYYKKDINVLVSPGFTPITIAALRKFAQYLDSPTLFYKCGGKTFKRLY